MADTSALDTAGPSSITEAELAQEVKLAEEKFQEGIQAIKVSASMLRMVLVRALF